MGNLPDTTMAGQRQQRVNRGRWAGAAALVTAQVGPNL